MRELTHLFNRTFGAGDGEQVGEPNGSSKHVRHIVFRQWACLHWGWIRNADDLYLDPLLLVDAPRPVRLLPLWRGDPVR